MRTNVGIIDRVLRFVAGIALLAWARGHFGPAPVDGWGWLVFAAGAALTFTALFRYCPAYALFGTHTCADDIRHR